jgi:hypothetical protein
MTPDRPPTTTDRRAAYLAAALDLRRMAVSAHSAEARDAFMRLVELYQELAEYAAITPSTPSDGGTAAAAEDFD